MEWFAIIRYLDNESERKKRHIIPAAKVAGFMPANEADFSKTKRYKAHHLKKSGKWSTTLYECQILQISDSMENLEEILKNTRITVPLVESTDDELQSEYDIEELDFDEKLQNRKKSQPSKRKVSAEDRDLSERLKQRKLENNSATCSGISPTVRSEEPEAKDSCELKEKETEIKKLIEKLELVTRQRDEYQALNKELQKALLSRLAKTSQRSGSTVGSVKLGSFSKEVHKEGEEQGEGDQQDNVAATASMPERYCTRMEGGRTEIHLENDIWVAKNTLDYARGRSDDEFVGVMAKAMWGSHILAGRSLTGKPPQGQPDKAPKKAVTPRKLAALRALYVDFIREKDLQFEESERRVKNFNRIFTAKLNNATRRFRKRNLMTKSGVPAAQENTPEMAD